MTTEEDFTKKAVMPLLLRLGFRGIRYTHGRDEHGRDLIFYDYDRFGYRLFCGAQIKLGSIKGTQKATIQNEIIPQLKEAISTPYRDPTAGETIYLNRIYLIISGYLVGTAKEQFHAFLSSQPNVILLDRQSIDPLFDLGGIKTRFGVVMNDKDVNNETAIHFGNRNYEFRLPILSKGTDLDMLSWSESFDTDCLTIESVSYDPIMKSQTVGLRVCDSELTSSKADEIVNEINKYFLKSGLMLSELIFDEFFCP